MTDYASMESGFSFLWKTLQTYQKPGFLLFLAAAALFLVGLCGRRKGRVLFVYPALLAALTVFNPYVFPILFDSVAEFQTEYYRFVWVIPVCLLVTFGFASLLLRVGNRLVRLLITVGLLGVLIGTSVPSMMAYTTEARVPANLELTDPELIMICDYIRDDAGTDEPSAAFEDPEMRVTMREYDPSFDLSPVFTIPEDMENSKTLEQAIELYQPEYLIVRKGGDAAAFLEEIGIKAIAYTPYHLVYARTME